MVREKGEGAALDKIAEMADCSMRRQKFSVKGGILGFGGGKGAGKKGKGLPRTVGKLFQNGADS